MLTAIIKSQNLKMLYHYIQSNTFNVFSEACLDYVTGEVDGQFEECIWILTKAILGSTNIVCTH